MWASVIGSTPGALGSWWRHQILGQIISRISIQGVMALTHHLRVFFISDHPCKNLNWDAFILQLSSLLSKLFVDQHSPDSLIVLKKDVLPRLNYSQLHFTIESSESFLFKNWNSCFWITMIPKLQWSPCNDAFTMISTCFMS